MQETNGLHEHYLNIKTQAAELKSKIKIYWLRQSSTGGKRGKKGEFEAHLLEWRTCWESSVLWK
jgi:hypothetical protein